MKNLSKGILLILTSILLSISAVSQTITLDPNVKEPLNTRIHNGCAVDIGFTGRLVPRDVLSDPYYTQIQEIGFTGLNFSGVSTADYAHILINTAAPAIGDGYNCSPPCPDQDGGKIFGKDFFEEFFALCDQLKVEKGYIVNVQTGTLQEVYDACESGVMLIIWGGEQNLEENSSFWPNAGASYKDKIEAWQDSINRHYPGRYHVNDAAPAWINASRRNKDWNAGQAGMSGDAGRFFIWADEAFDCATLSQMNTFWDTGIKEWEDAFDGWFPEQKKAVVQWGWKTLSPNLNSGMNALWIAKGYRYFIDNQEEYGMVSFMSVKSLDNSQNSRETLKLIGKLFTGKNVVTTTETIDGIEAIAIEGDGKYSVLVINETGATKSINVKIAGTKQTMNATGLWFSSLTSKTGTVYTQTGTKNINVQPYSVTIFEW